MLLPKNKEEEQGKEVGVGRGCGTRGTVEIRVEFFDGNICKAQAILTL